MVKPQVDVQDEPQNKTGRAYKASDLPKASWKWVLTKCGKQTVFPSKTCLYTHTKFGIIKIFKNVCEKLLQFKITFYYYYQC